MMKNQQSSISFFLCACILLFLSGCDGHGDRSDSNAPKPVIAVGSQWYGHVPLWIGIERGIFSRYGFAVEWRVIGKSMDRLNAVSSGEAQFASLGEIAMLSAMAQGNRRFYWVGNQDIAPGFEGLVAQQGIQHIADLKGKKIGLPFGSSVDITCRLLLRQHGLDPDRDVQLVNLEVGDVPAVFRAGNVAAALIWEPGFSQLRAVPGATVLAMDTDTEVYKKFATMTGPDVLVVARQWADNDPVQVRRFLQAYFEALDWVAENTDAAAEIVRGKYIQQDLPLLQRNLHKFVWHNARQQRSIMSEEGIYAQAEVILDILYSQMHAIPVKPEFRKWVNLDIVPAGQQDITEQP